MTEEQIQEAWNRATVVDGYDKDRYRKYGDTDSLYGWEVDHIVPQSLLREKGYSEMMIDYSLNLRALQHENNASKSDDYPSYTAVVTSEGTENVRVTKFLEVNKKKQEALKKLYDI